MTIGVLTLAQLKTLFHGITVSILGLDGAMVRMAFPKDGQPIGKVENDLAYISITPIDDPYDKQRDIVYGLLSGGNVEQAVFYTRVMQISWILYGPSSFDNADSLRHGLLLESNRVTLGAQGVYPVPAISAPTRMPDNFNGQWWERSDLQIVFYVATLRDGSTPAIASITVDQESGDGQHQVIQVSI